MAVSSSRLGTIVLGLSFGIAFYLSCVDTAFGVLFARVCVLTNNSGFPFKAASIGERQAVSIKVALIQCRQLSSLAKYPQYGDKHPPGFLVPVTGKQFEFLPHGLFESLMVVAVARLDLNFRTQFDNRIVWQMQKIRGSTCIAVHLRKEYFTPRRHATSDARDHGIARKEVAG